MAATAVILRFRDDDEEDEEDELEFLEPDEPCLADLVVFFTVLMTGLGVCFVFFLLVPEILLVLGLTGDFFADLFCDLTSCEWSFN